MNPSEAKTGERQGAGEGRDVARVTTGPEMARLLDHLDAATGDEKKALQGRIADELVDLLRRSQEGDRSAIPALQVFVERRPHYLGRLDIAGFATKTLVDQAAAGDVFLAERFTREIERVRDDLAGAAPTALERLLAERVALTWFDATDADTRFSANMANAQGEYYGRYRERATRRFLQAAKMLATVRKLALPAIQVNIGENQINMTNS